MKRWLVDTGPFVAYLDRADATHDEVAACLEAFSGELFTTGAIVTEVMYIVSDSPDGPGSFADLLASAAVRIVETMEAAQVAAAATLMKKYRDTPMDFADATLVLAAERLGVLDVLTLDRRGFSTYRMSKGRSFRLVLDA